MTATRIAEGHCVAEKVGVLSQITRTVEHPNLLDGVIGHLVVAAYLLQIHIHPDRLVKGWTSGEDRDVASRTIEGNLRPGGVGYEPGVRGLVATPPIWPVADRVSSGEQCQEPGRLEPPLRLFTLCVRPGVCRHEMYFIRP